MGGEQELREPETTEESMTVRGHYRITGSDTTPAPFVQARVWVRGAGAHVPVEFLVSTGAAVTLLAPGDVRNLGIGPDDLDRDTLRTSTGVWGAVAHYDAPAELIFQGEELQAAWNGRIRVCNIWGAPEAGRKNEMPSLLGTDFLRHTSARFNSREDLLAIELRPEQGRLVLERRNRK